MPENIVESYGWNSASDTCSHRYITPGVLSALKTISSKKVLDLGCGNGALCSAINQAGYQVVGAEYDAAGIEIASSKNPTIAFYNVGVQDSPAQILEKEGRFDTVVSTEVIEHLFSPHLLLEFSNQVLTDKGHLIISTPYHGYLKNLALAVLNKWDSHHDPLWHGGHIKFWSKRTLTKLLADNGFKLVAFSGLGRAPLLWKSMLLLAQKI